MQDCVVAITGTKGVTRVIGVSPVQTIVASVTIEILNEAHSAATADIQKAICGVSTVVCNSPMHREYTAYKSL